MTKKLSLATPALLLCLAFSPQAIAHPLIRTPQPILAVASSPPPDTPPKDFGMIYTPLAFGPMKFKHWGGPTVGAHRVHLVWWDNGLAWPAGYQQHIRQYFQDVAQDSGKGGNAYSVVWEYRLPYQVTYDGEAAISSPYPSQSLCRQDSLPPCLSQAQLQSALLDEMQKQGWRLGLEDLYFVFTPPGVTNCTSSFGCSGEDWLADHESAKTQGKYLFWAMMPYVQEIGRSPLDTITASLSHEHIEMITDPVAPPYSRSGAAWLTGPGEPQEISDLCAPVSPPKQWIAGHPYRTSWQWSNRRGACAASSTLRDPIASITYPRKAKHGQIIRLDARGSKDPAGQPLGFEWRSGGWDQWGNWSIGANIISRAGLLRTKTPKQGKWMTLDLKLSSQSGQHSYRTLRIKLA